MQVKARTFSGVVCEQIVYMASNKCKDPARAKLRPRFATDEDRAKHRNEIARKRHARLFNATFDPSAFYVTLTCDDEHELYNYKDAKAVLERYLRRLMYAYPDAVIFAYKGRGRSTERIHFHMVCKGIPREAIVEKWECGMVTRIKRLRDHCYYDGVDHGQDYTGLANYLFNHWEPEQGGHRFATRGKYTKPDTEAPVEVKRPYSEDKPPVPPKGYILVEKKSTPYGYLYFKYVKKPPVDKHGPRVPMEVDWDD